MTNPCCKDCPARHLACHDSCEKFKSWREEHKAERAYTNRNQAAERINRNDFNKEGWMGGRRK